MHCRRIRRGDEEHGDWLNLEQFLSAHSGASFTHGICAECFAVHHPE
jgi:hypothetical protein